MEVNVATERATRGVASILSSAFLESRLTAQLVERMRPVGVDRFSCVAKEQFGDRLDGETKKVARFEIKL